MKLTTSRKKSNKFQKIHLIFLTGFLNLEDEIAPGNQGLQDILFLLKWIKANIAKFGGDPDNVTLLGEDSGAMSVHILAVSPVGQGNFRNNKDTTVFHPQKKKI